MGTVSQRIFDTMTSRPESEAATSLQAAAPDIWESALESVRKRQSDIKDFIKLAKATAEKFAIDIKSTPEVELWSKVYRALMDRKSEKGTIKAGSVVAFCGFCYKTAQAEIKSIQEETMFKVATYDVLAKLQVSE